MPTFIPDLLALLRSAEGLAPGGPESSCLTATNQVFDGPHLIVVLPLTLLLPSPAAMPTPRREREEGPVLARAVPRHAVKGRVQDRRHDHRQDRAEGPPGHQLLELGAFPSSRPVDDGRVVELDQALFLQILDLEESLDRPLAVGNIRADNVAKRCSSPCLA